MPNDQIPATETPDAMSNQVIAQHLLARGLPTESTEMLQVFMQFLANEVVNRMAQGATLADCSALMDRYARFDSLRQRAIATKLRAAKARQQQAAAETSPEAAPTPAAPTSAAEAEPPTPSPSSPASVQRAVHISRQQRRALLRKLTQTVTLTDGVANAS